MQFGGPQLLKIRGDSIKSNTAIRCYFILMLGMLGFFLVVSLKIPRSLDEISPEKDCYLKPNSEKIGQYCSSMDFN
jgi:hypothetical protein